jgi:hypothetical protein
MFTEGALDGKSAERPTVNSSTRAATSVSLSVAPRKFKESDDVGRSRAQDRPRQAKTKSRKGQGDRGDR